WKKQILYIVVGSMSLVGVTLLDYHLYARFARHFYIANLILLLIVLKFAPNINGAARWINLAGFKFQPSEFAKVLVILALAAFLTKHHETIRELKTFLLSLLYILPPMALIFKQNDLGTALVVLAIWFGMVFMAGVRVRHLVGLIVIGSLLFTGLWMSGKVIKDYQKQRITTWLRSIFDPEADKGKAGYHVYQARTAIGSGQFFGKGWLQGTMVHGGYIPERQTDFIYTTVGEEFGFIGCCVVLTLYAGILFRGIVIVASSDEDLYGKLIGSGVLAMFAFHVLINIGMNVGILPVTGVPLPLISAGGSNVIVTLTSIGLLESVSIHRHQLLF
ncbi:MAG TPA: rod shape-determining protein RodA, partial [Chthonomonadaceae bacterium]|nr:rod shape-determining protein RodA [Chthonomonadaceae bacterium]